MRQRSVWELFADDGAQGLAEYALIIALLSMVALAALRILGARANNTLSNAATNLR